MIYEFFCKKCNAIDEVRRHHMDMDEPVHCPDCNGAMKRHYTPPVVKTQGESIPYFHPTLGQLVKSDAHAAEIARSRGLVEVGNEDIHKHTGPVKRHNYDSPDYFL